jgi:hypothetical protein
MTRCPPRRRRRYLNRGTTPLYWADAPFEYVQQLYRAARRATPWFHGSSGDPALDRQPWLRAVSIEFQRRLREERIYVEGL